jgi:hypothetical protein
MKYTLSPSKIREEILEMFSLGLVPYVRSSPGLGKTSIYHQIAKDYNLKLIDLSVGTATPEDFMGYPHKVGNKATFLPFDHFPLEGDEIPKGYNGWLLFLDEFSSGSKAVQAAAYKLVLSRFAGSYKLHDNCLIACAGNREIDNAVVVKLSTAMKSRLVHYEMVGNVPDFVEWATAEALDFRVISFAEFMPSVIEKFDPNHSGETFPCPRTIAMLGKAMIGKTINADLGPRIAGMVGDGTCVEFLGYARAFGRIKSYNEIVKNADSTSVPDELSVRHATIAMLASQAKSEDLDAILVYVKKFSLEFQIVFMRKLTITQPTYRYDHKGFGKYLMDMMRYLSGEQ